MNQSQGGIRGHVLTAGSDGAVERIFESGARVFVVTIFSRQPTPQELDLDVEGLVAKGRDIAVQQAYLLERLVEPSGQ
ncbi:MAG: hypothetical protein KC501_03555, partial [Myxococcales bacterium]|nr:hypothetical protein [Myxococcales bacterium]